MLYKHTYYVVCCDAPAALRCVFHVIAACVMFSDAEGHARPVALPSARRLLCGYGHGARCHLAYDAQHPTMQHGHLACKRGFCADTGTLRALLNN